MSRRGTVEALAPAARARASRAYRRVLHTGARTQLVAMRLRPGERVGFETHPRVEQSFWVVSGAAEIRWGRGGARVVRLRPGLVGVVPPGVRHDLVNAGRGELVLYTLYAPPNHLPGTVHATKAAAARDAADEAFGRRVR